MHKPEAYTFPKGFLTKQEPFLSVVRHDFNEADRMCENSSLPSFISSD